MQQQAIITNQYRSFTAKGNHLNNAEMIKRKSLQVCCSMHTDPLLTVPSNYTERNHYRSRNTISSHTKAVTKI